ncbi:MAG TPA: condensation domain-containing protein, partial [Streptosporangiaceae bacterium]|nr:condensation domain-containing protein [Streptosporangiaceae bacterium]
MPVIDGARRELTAAQLGIWYAHQLGSDEPVYNMGEYLDIRGDLDVAAFEAALRQVMHEAETARLRFAVEDGQPRQYVAASGDWTLHVSDLRDASDQVAAAVDQMWADMRRPVDLLATPLFAHALYQVGPDRFLWYQRGHHIAVDAFSGAIVAARVAQVYSALLAGQPAADGALEPLAVLLDADARYRSSPSWRRDQDFWHATLDGVPDAVSASGHRVRAARRFAVRHAEDLDPVAAARLRSAAGRLKTSVTGLMVTAAAAFAHRCTGAEDVVLGLPVLGRTGRRQRAIPGMTANVLPVRLAVSGEQSAAQLARQVNGTVRAAFQHQRYRYEDILRDRKLVDGAALFGLVVNVMPFDYALRFGTCVATAHSLAGGPVGDMRISVYDGAADGGIELALDMNRDLYGDDAGAHLAH